MTAASSRPTLWTPIVALNFGTTVAEAPHNVGQLWSGWNFYLGWEVGMYIVARRSGWRQVVTRLRNRSTSHADANVRAYADIILKIGYRELVNRGSNPRFLEGDTGWVFEFNPRPEEPVRYSNFYTQDEVVAARVGGTFTAGGISQQRLPAQPGFMRQSVWIYVPRFVQPRGSLMTYWFAYNAAGALINRRTGELRSLKDCVGQWTELTHMDLLPEGTASVSAYVSLFEVTHGTEFHCAGGEFLQVEPGADYSFAPTPKVPG